MVELLVAVAVAVEGGGVSRSSSERSIRSKATTVSARDRETRRTRSAEEEDEETDVPPALPLLLPMEASTSHRTGTDAATSADDPAATVCHVDRFAVRITLVLPPAASLPAPVLRMPA